MLRSLKVDLKVQQELLRHADIRTTMDVYTQPVPEALREAKSKVVEMALPAAVGVQGGTLLPRGVSSFC